MDQDGDKIKVQNHVILEELSSQSSSLISTLISIGNEICLVFLEVKIYNVMFISLKL